MNDFVTTPERNGTTQHDGPLEPQNAGGIDQQRPESRPANDAGLAPASPAGGPLDWLRWCVVQWHNDLATGRVKLR